MGIGARIREERERLGYSQPAFAAMADSSKNSQLSWEKEAAYPNARALAAWAAVGVDVLYVITGQHAGGVKPAPTLKAEEATMLEYFRAAPPAVRRAAMGALLGAAGAPSHAPHSIAIGDMRNTTPGGVQVGYAGGSVTVGQKNKRKREE